MKIRFVDKCLILTTNTKPVKGDWMCGLQVGHTSSDGRVIIARKRFLTYHDDTPVSRLNAICHGTEKVVAKIDSKKIIMYFSIH